jgi:hypothetical protein
MPEAAKDPAVGADTVEAETERLMRAAMPREFAEMTKARARRAGEPAADLAHKVLTHEPPKPKERVIRVAAAPGDAEIEAVLGSLMCETFAASRRSYQLAQEATTVGLRDLHVHQAARLSRACAEVATALMRSRGKCERVVVQYIKGSQVVGVVNK